uniref:VWFA domain-containing protein n=1 Tax=Panagrellus redivivus TaxID=6233 RepID=A0A7E4VQI6_PANRE
MHIVGFLAVLGLVGSVSACTDFVFAIDTGADDQISRNGLARRRDLAVKTVQALELGSGPHRAALVVYGQKHLKPNVAVNFEDALGSEAFIAKIRSEIDGVSKAPNATENIVAESLGSSDAVDVITRQVVPRRRMGAPVVVLFFTDGRIRPNETTKLEAVTEKLGKKHYVRVFAVNPENVISPERLAMLEALTNGETNAIITAKNGQPNVENDVKTALKPFLSCEQFTKSRTLRRKPNTMARASVAPTTETPLTKVPLFARTNRLRNFGTSATTLRTQPTTTLRTTTQRAFTGKPGCLVDLIFLLDFSGGAIDKREKYLNLAADIIRSIPLGEFNYQIAFVRYSGPRRTDTVFHLKKHYDAEAAIAEMAASPPMGGTTRTGAAMLDAYREYDAKYGGRSKASKVMLVMTDGYSQDDPVDASAKLHQERVKVLAVAFDDSLVPPDVDQLKAIATEPKNAFLEQDIPKLKQQFTLPNNCRS